MQPGVILDIILVVVLIGFLIRGWRAGLLGSLGGLVGLAAGGVGAFFAIPLVASWVPDAAWRGWAAVAAAVVVLAVGYTIGAFIGGAIGSVVRKTPLRGLERLLGAALNLVVTALVLVTAALGVGSLGIPLLAQAVGSSAVIGTIDRVTPVQVKSTLAQLRSTVVDGGAQRVIEAFGGTADVPAAPQLDTSTPALQTASASVVRISGTAESCSRSLTGSGFVFADDLVMTNAHVLAGVTNPVVEVPGAMPRKDGSSTSTRSTTSPSSASTTSAPDRCRSHRIRRPVRTPSSPGIRSVARTRPVARRSSWWGRASSPTSAGTTRRAVRS